MRMQKRKFRIGELAKHLDVERFVIRFWEKEFMVKTTRSEGGQRFYDEEDLNRFEMIKDLLYNRGFTISGAKQELKSRETNAKVEKSIHKKNSFEPAYKEKKDLPDEITHQIITLQKQLLKLRNLL